MNHPERSEMLMIYLLEGQFEDNSQKLLTTSGFSTSAEEPWCPSTASFATVPSVVNAEDIFKIVTNLVFSSFVKMQFVTKLLIKHLFMLFSLYLCNTHV